MVWESDSTGFLSLSCTKMFKSTCLFLQKISSKGWNLVKKVVHFV